MARLVVMRDKKPLVIKKEDMTEEALWICRCGLSAGWPECDGSHKRTSDEMPDRLYEYTRRAPDDDLMRTESNDTRRWADPRAFQDDETEARV